MTGPGCSKKGVKITGVGERRPARTLARPRGGPGRGTAGMVCVIPWRRPRGA